MKEQKFLDFAPGEQEAIAQAAHDSSRVSLALRNAERRCNRMIAGLVFIILSWMILSMTCFNPLMDLVMSWTFRIRVHVPWTLYFWGRWLGIAVVVAVWFYNQSGRCHEFGQCFQIGRLTLSKRVVTAIGVLVCLWLLVLMVWRIQGVPKGMTWEEAAFTTNLTGFMIELLVYMSEFFVLLTLVTSREQLIREEKWALGIFE